MKLRPIIWKYDYLWHAGEPGNQKMWKTRIIGWNFYIEKVKNKYELYQYEYCDRCGHRLNCIAIMNTLKSAKEAVSLQIEKWLKEYIE